MYVVGSYTAFFLANTIPGRLDTKLGRPKKSDMRFFTPSGWAFAIWAPIFLGEIILSATAIVYPGIVTGVWSCWPVFAVGFVLLWTCWMCVCNMGKLSNFKSVLPICISVTTICATAVEPNEWHSYMSFLILLLALSEASHSVGIFIVSAVGTDALSR